MQNLHYIHSDQVNASIIINVLKYAPCGRLTVVLFSSICQALVLSLGTVARP